MNKKIKTGQKIKKPIEFTFNQKTSKEYLMKNRENIHYMSYNKFKKNK